MKVIIAYLALLLGVIGLIAVASMFSTMLWYCIDDHLALYTGIPVLGNLPFTFVWPACLFIGCLFRGMGGSSKSDSE